MSVLWRDQLIPGSVGARMLSEAEQAPWFDEIELHNLCTTDDAQTPLVRQLAARLYVTRKEHGYLSARLNNLGEPVELRHDDRVMRCAKGHVWIRNVELEKIKCPECLRAALETQNKDVA